MCNKTQKDCLKGNPPLVCCALNLFIFFVVLLCGGFYIVGKEELQNIDFIWAEQKGKNVTELGLKPLISTERAYLTEHHIFDLAILLACCILILAIYSCIPHKRYKEQRHLRLIEEA